VAEVGAGIVSTAGDLSVDGQPGSSVVINNVQANMDFRVRGQTNPDLLVIDASGDAIGLGVAAPSSLLDLAGAFTVQGMTAPALAAAGTGRLYFDSTANRFRVSENGGAFADLIVGSGAAGHVTFWTGAGSLSGEGDLYWDALNNRLGVRTPTPTHALEVASGQIAGPDGTAGSPGFAFAAEDDNGIYRAGTDDTRWVAGGLDRILVRSTGVTLQGAVEEIASGSGTTLKVRLNNAGAGVDQKRWAFAFDSAVNTNAFRLITENDALSSSVEVLAADRTGNIGIGTTAPGAKLDVRGSAVFNENGDAVNFRIEGDNDQNLFFVAGAADRIGIGTTGPNGKLGIAVVDGAVNGARGIRVDNTATQVALETGNANDSYIGTRSADSFSIRSNNIARLTASASAGMVINESGLDYDLRVEGLADANLLVVDASTDRVGLGTATPAGKLEVRDDAGINLVLTKIGAGVGTNDLMEFRTDLFTSGERHLFKWTTNSGALTVGRIGMEFDGTSNTIDFVFRDMFNVTATTVESMRLKGNGNLGLGVTDAQVRLDMLGALQLRGTAAPAVSPAGRGRIYFDSTTNKWRISENGGPYQDLLAVGSIGGSGTANQIAFFTGATTLASDSDLYWDSTNNRLGVATASPNTAIDMAGAMSVRGVTAPPVSPAGQGRIYFDSATNKWRISENGGPYQDLLGVVSGVTGSGTTGQLTVWNGTTVVTGDAQLFWDTANNYLGVDKAIPSSTLDVGGSMASAVVTLVANTALDDTHHTVLGDASGGTFTLTLPLASAAAGREYKVKKIDSSSNVVTIARAGGDTIDGATSVALGSQYQAITLVSNGSNWFLF